MPKWGAGIAVILGFAVAVLGQAVVGEYNRLVHLDQAVRAQWAQVENVYQKRADLVPNLVETVKGAATFEKNTFTAVTEARSRVGRISGAGLEKIASDPAAFAKFQEAQDDLSAALARLMVVVERYPDLKATEDLGELQAQLESTENRIAIERMRFNEAAQAFNTRRQSFPTVLIAGLFGDRFREKAFFKAQSEGLALTAPRPSSGSAVAREQP